MRLLCLDHGDSLFQIPESKTSIQYRQQIKHEYASFTALGKQILSQAVEQRFLIKDHNEQFLYMILS